MFTKNLLSGKPTKHIRAVTFDETQTPDDTNLIDLNTDSEAKTTEDDTGLDFC